MTEHAVYPSTSKGVQMVHENQKWDVVVVDAEVMPTIVPTQAIDVITIVTDSMSEPLQSYAPSSLLPYVYRAHDGVSFAGSFGWAAQLYYMNKSDSVILETISREVRQPILIVKMWIHTILALDDNSIPFPDSLMLPRWSRVILAAKCIHGNMYWNGKIIPPQMYEIALMMMGLNGKVSPPKGGLFVPHTVKYQEMRWIFAASCDFTLRRNCRETVQDILRDPLSVFSHDNIRFGCLVAAIGSIPELFVGGQGDGWLAYRMQSALPHGSSVLFPGVPVLIPMCIWTTFLLLTGLESAYVVTDLVDVWPKHFYHPNYVIFENSKLFCYSPADKIGSSKVSMSKLKQPSFISPVNLDFTVFSKQCFFQYKIQKLRLFLLLIKQKPEYILVTTQLLDIFGVEMEYSFNGMRRVDDQPLLKPSVVNLLARLSYRTDLAMISYTYTHVHCLEHVKKCDGYGMYQAIEFISRLDIDWRVAHSQLLFNGKPVKHCKRDELANEMHKLGSTHEITFPEPRRFSIKILCLGRHGNQFPKGQTVLRVFPYGTAFYVDSEPMKIDGMRGRKRAELSPTPLWQVNCTSLGDWGGLTSIDNYLETPMCTYAINKSGAPVETQFVLSDGVTSIVQRGNTFSSPVIRVLI